jgi:hypothetical protein
MQKDILARLLATENITVVHENAPTASFNVKDRVLTLPLWEDLTGDNYDHFIGHEVGHALYTPEEGWHDAVCDRGRAYKSFLNVIEDARIERLIQNKYPGLRRNFIKSYRKLLADGFFGANIDEINTFDLIDRINSYFKLGVSAGVRIEKDEMCWIKEIEECVTWEQVVDITNRLFAQEKQKKEEQMQEQEELQQEMSSGETDEQPSDGFDQNDWEMDDEEEQEDQEGSSGEGTEDDEIQDEDSEEQEGIQQEEDEEDLDPTDPISRTEESLHSNIRKEFSDGYGTKVYNLKLNINKINEIIIDYKTVYCFGADVTGYGKVKPHLAMYGEDLWKKFQIENKKTVNYMVKEFEMKKKASEYARTSLSKTGVICPVKMNNYKFSDDIFRKMAVTPEGKNHGMVLYLDWSGSMHKHMKSTIDQLLNLVMFCRQVNIPYRVYAFTDRFSDKPLAVNTVEINTLQYKNGFRLMEFFNNKMNRREFTEMAQMLLAIGQNYIKDVSYYLPYQFYLGGTPLDDAIMAGIQIHKEFQKSNRLDIVNTVFLTDGDSHPIECKIRSEFRSCGYSENVTLWNLGIKYNIIKFIDPVTKKQYRVQGKNGYTKSLLEMFKDHTGSNAIGYRILPVNKRSMFGDLKNAGCTPEQIIDIQNDLKKNKFSTIPNCGYDKFFAIAGGKNLETSNGAIQVADDANVGAIRTAFKKANAGRKNSRVLLSQFIELVA